MPSIKNMLQKKVHIDTTRMDSLREGHMRMLRDSPTRYHLTVTFKYGVSEKKSIELINKFLLYVNRAILRNRFSKKGEFLKGFAVKESTPSMDNIHFHITLSDKENKLPSLDRLEEIIQSKIHLINKSTNSMDQINRYLLQNYWRGSADSNLEKYLTKTHERHDLTEDQKLNSICPLGHEGINFG